MAASPPPRGLSLSYEGGEEGDEQRRVSSGNGEIQFGSKAWRAGGSVDSRMLIRQELGDWIQNLPLLSITQVASSLERRDDSDSKGSNPSRRERRRTLYKVGGGGGGGGEGEREVLLPHSHPSPFLARAFEAISEALHGHQYPHRGVQEQLQLQQQQLQLQPTNTPIPPPPSPLPSPPPYPPLHAPRPVPLRRSLPAMTRESLALGTQELRALREWKETESDVEVDGREGEGREGEGRGENGKKRGKRTTNYLDAISNKPHPGNLTGNSTTHLIGPPELDTMVKAARLLQPWEVLQNRKGGKRSAEEKRAEEKSGEEEIEGIREKSKEIQTRENGKRKLGIWTVVQKPWEEEEEEEGSISHCVIGTNRNKDRNHRDYSASNENLDDGNTNRHNNNNSSLIPATSGTSPFSPPKIVSSASSPAYPTMSPSSSVLYDRLVRQNPYGLPPSVLLAYQVALAAGVRPEVVEKASIRFRDLMVTHRQD
eukprot:CAMPEP_0175068140 /NCGR_PEP_ID=MMETSP0052_2-20121109/17507_1 /TAXON_ID=51329 ORGANISM="Polytomella parva, Strain SAG 63-3" /NCGR_SAMPLE_ID=MMETSP0052_2 /ASSEMBLY_ACC=CAM_ASM_000194 /LENGTH=482 /DNA_ID=CAMNT_0016335137 /DNA_START=393 /DNA_END=1842 /DNA_ORIENTATION=-